MNLLRGKSLSFRIQLWFTSLIGVLLCAFVIVGGKLIETNVYRDHDKRMLDLAERYSINVRNRLRVERNQSTKTKVVERIKRTKSEIEKQFIQNNYYYVVINNKNEIIVKSKNIPATIDLKFRKKGQAYQKIRAPQGRRESFYANPKNISVVVGVYTKQLDNAVLRGYSTFAAVALGLLVLSVIVGNLIVRYSLRPLRSIHNTAKDIADGKLASRIGNDTKSAPAELAPLVTELNDAFGYLEQSFDYLKRYSENLSHELRTPVAGLLAELEAILNRTRSAEEYEHSLNRCLQMVERLHASILQIEFLASLEKPQNEIDEPEEIIDLMLVVEGIAVVISPLAKEKSLQLLIEGESVNISGSTNLINQAISSLIKNAIDYTERGHVAIKLKKLNGMAELEISDTGIGIANHELQHVFERHFRANDMRKPQGAHSGLGLAIAKEIITRYQGEIKIFSERGKGTRVCVTLPIVDPIAENNC